MRHTIARSLRWLAPCTLLLAAGSALAAPTIEQRTLEGSGVPLLVVRTPGVPIVHLLASLDGGVLDEPEGKDGTTALLLRTARRATAGFSYEAVNDLLDRTGGRLSASAGVDSAGLGLSCVKSFLPDLVPLWAGALLAPSLPEAPLQREQRRMIDEARRALDSPDGRLERLAGDLAFKGHPYARRPDGLPETLQGITADELRAHHEHLVRARRLRIVAVGDLDPDVLAATLSKALAGLPPGDPQPGLPAWKPAAAAARVEARELKTDYLLAFFALPGPGEQGYEASRLAFRILSEDLWERVRTRKGLAYAVSCGVAAARANFGYLYASSTDPEAVIREIHAAVDALIAEPPDGKRIRDTLAVFATEYYSSRRRNQAIAGAVAHAARAYGDPARAFDLVDRLSRVSPEAVAAALRAGFRNLQWGALGDAGRIPAELLEKR